MELANQQAIDALQRAVGHHPFGMSGYGQAFGALPAMTRMPDYYSQMQGGTFFGPQLLHPHRFSFGSGLIGQAGGSLFEQYAAGRGYQYMPRYQSLADVVQAREFDAGLRTAVRSGASFDENRLARAIEKGFKAAFGSISPYHTAQANALASINAPILNAMGMMSYLPGGSAQDFARSMFLAQQNLRDTTKTRYKLGMSGEESAGMINRLLDYFAPRGEVSTQKTRGLALGDVGSLAGELSRFGLLQVDEDPQQLQELSDKLGVNVDELPTGEAEQLRAQAKTISVGRHLQAYADVVGTMRELMGDPNAPIPDIIRNLQQMTGGQMQQMDPTKIQDMVFRVKEMARASNITVSAMTEIVKEGAMMSQQWGVSPILGGQIASEAALATVASQTMFGGPYKGRMDPDEEMNIRHQRMQRLMVAPGVNVSVQAQRLLEGVDVGTLTEEQRAVYDDISARARNAEFNMRNLPQLLDQFESIGVGRSQAQQFMQSSVGVQTWLESHPEFRRQATLAQLNESGAMLQRASSDWFESIRDSGDDVSQSIISAAEDAGKTPDQLARMIGESYSNAPRGSRAEREAWLRDQGIDTTALNMDAIFDRLEANQWFHQNVRNQGFDKAEKLSSYLSKERFNAAQDLLNQVDTAVQGRKFLKNLDVELRGGAFERVMGALSEYDSGAKIDRGELLFKAFGFEPTAEMRQQIDEEVFSSINKTRGELDELAKRRKELAGDKSPEAKRELHEIDTAEAELKATLRTQATAAYDIIRPLEGLETTVGIQKMLPRFTPEVRAAAKQLQDTDLSTDERIEAFRTIATAFEGMTANEIESAKVSLGRDSQLFGAHMNVMRIDAGNVLEKLKEADAAEEAGDVERAAEIRERVAGSNDINNLFSTANMGYRMLRRGELTSRMRASGGRTLRDRVDVWNTIETLNKRFIDADTPEARREALSKLQAAMHGAREILFDVNEDGAIVGVNEELIKDLTLRDRSLSGDPEAQFDYADRLRARLKARQEQYAAATLVPAYDLDDEEIEELQEDKYVRVEGQFALDPSKIIGVEKLDDDVINMIKGAGGRLSGKYAQEAKIENSINLLRDVMALDMPEGKEGVDMRARLLQRVLEGSDIYEDGQVRERAMEWVYQGYSDAEARTILSQLHKFAPVQGQGVDKYVDALSRDKKELDELAAEEERGWLGWAWDTAKSITPLDDFFSKKETPTEQVAGMTLFGYGDDVWRWMFSGDEDDNTKPGTKGTAGSAMITFLDSAGNELDNMQIVVNTNVDSSGRGREASQKLTKPVIT